MEHLSIYSSDLKEIVIEPAQFLGDFSLDVDRKFCKNNKENLKFIKNYDWKSNTTKVHYDLNKDIHGRISKDMDKMQSENITHILQWILLNKEKVYVENNQVRRIFPDFVCFRGRLSQILNAPYANNEEWMFHVVKYGGTIYLMEVETENNKLARLNESERNKIFCAWGHKFEQQILGEDGPLNEVPEYCCVFKTTLAGHSLLSVAEVDAAEFERYDCNKDDFRSYVEFKTNKLFTYGGAEKTFRRYKARKWWAQSAIIGIPEVICGFRTEEGVVTETRAFNVTQLPYYNESSSEYEGTMNFNPMVMLNFLKNFFDWLKVVVKEESPTVYQIVRRKNDNSVYCQTVPSSSFITKDYIDAMFPVVGDVRQA